MRLKDLNKGNSEKGGRGIIQKVILTSNKGDRVKLDRRNFIGIDMNR